MEGKNSVGNVEAKQFISMTHGHDYRGGMQEGGRGQDQVEWRGNGTTLIAYSINTFKKKFRHTKALGKMVSQENSTDH